MPSFKLSPPKITPFCLPPRALVPGAGRRDLISPAFRICYSMRQGYFINKQQGFAGGKHTAISHSQMEVSNPEDEAFEPVAPVIKKALPKGMWDDEDADDQDVKESWEDDEDVTQPPKPEPTVEKPVSKPSGKAAGKKAKQPEKKTSQVDDEVLSDPVAEKLRQQRLVEEADYRSTAELFAKKGDEKSLDNFIPKSDSDFAEYAELLSHKIRPYEKSFHYIGLLKAVMRLSMTSLKAADAKEIASSVTAIANEKLKAEKEANAGKKKQGAKKKQLHVEKAEDDMVTGVYDAADDYDFM